LNSITDASLIGVMAFSIWVTVSLRSPFDRNQLISTVVLSPVHTVYGAVRRRTHMDVRRRTVPYVHVRQCTATQDTADAKSYATYRCCQWAQLHCRPYGDEVCVNAAVEINALDNDVAVRRRTQCERGFVIHAWMVQHIDMLFAPYDRAMLDARCLCGSWACCLPSFQLGHSVYMLYWK